MSLPIGSIQPRRPSLARSNAVVAAGTLLSRVTGFGRIAALAYALGVTRVTDAYNVANNTPNIVYELLLGGILTATLVPVFVEHLERRDDDAIGAIVGTATAALIALTVAATLAAPLIVGFYTQQVGSDEPQVREVATDLARFFLPQIFFYGMTAIGTALLNARRQFGLPAFAPVLNNVVVIVVLVIVGAAFGQPENLQELADDRTLMLLLGVGTTAGIVAMTVVLLPGLRAAGVHLRPRFAPDHPAVRAVIGMAGWTVAYVAANQVALAIVTVLALREPAEYTAYQFAYILFQLPHGLLAVSVTTTFAPDLAGAATRENWDRFRRRFTVGYRLIALVVLPAAAGYIALADPLVEVLLRRGAVDAAAAARVADVLAAMAAGLGGFSLYLYTLRGFYALKDTRTPCVLSVFQNGLNIALAVVLVDRHGSVGLAWAFAISYLVSAAVALVVLSRRVRDLPVPGLATTVGLVLLAAEGMGAIVRLGTGWIDSALVRTLAGVVLGVPVFVALLAVVRPPSVAALVGRRTQGAGHRYPPIP